uniref:Uncharacterized protein n=2 Tax=Ditylum brightwellii TaxID=49249 RepID=A0A6U3SM00_9STRA|mmetsp:Transcript_45075/g.67926  ORF Transcript_45075/g.67926 Transcript_45075/m.67926 type:complete len:545 (+) Transcript_45075:73-1707(+)
MYTATTNLVAAAQGIDSNVVKGIDTNGENTKYYPRTTKTFITALQLALMVGISFGTFIGLFGGTLLRVLMGGSGSNNSLDPAVFAAALRYVRIRALGMPAAVVIGTAQSACLGMQDVRSPLYVLIAAAVVNFLGDAMLVRVGHPWIGGAAGAAWATTISQYSALFLFVKWLQYKPHQARASKSNTETIKEETNQSSSSKSSDYVTAFNDVKANVTLGASSISKEGISTKKRPRNSLRNSLSTLASEIAPDFRPKLQLLSHKNAPASKKKRIVNIKSTTAAEATRIKSSPKSMGFLHGQFKASDLFRWSTMDTGIIKNFKPFAIPVTVSNVGRISGYLAMSHVASSALGTMDMAAHQIVFSFFCCLYPLVDALSHTAQSFVPTIFEKQASAGRTKALKQMYNNFFKAGAIFGLSILGLVMCIPFLSRFFTTDLSVIGKVRGAIPGLMTFFSVGGLMCVGEGMLLGQKDLKFLGRMYGAYFFIVPSIMLRLKKRSLLGIQDVGIGDMWGLFSIYQCVRVAIWHIRLRLLQRRIAKDTAGLSAESRS